VDAMIKMRWMVELIDLVDLQSGGLSSRVHASHGIQFDYTRDSRTLLHIISY
jgi:hypothetical protein